MINFNVMFLKYLNIEQLQLSSIINHQAEQPRKIKQQVMNEYLDISKVINQRNVRIRNLMMLVSFGLMIILLIIQSEDIRVDRIIINYTQQTAEDNSSQEKEYQQKLRQTEGFKKTQINMPANVEENKIQNQQNKLEAFKDKLVTMKQQGLQQIHTYEPSDYLNMTDIEFKQLPICIVSRNISKTQFIQIRQSLFAQNYSNYHMAYSSQFQFQESSEKIDSEKYRYVGKDLSRFEYLQLKDLIINNCDEYDLIFLVRQPLKLDTLTFINTLYQTRNIWMTFSSSNLQQKHSVQTFFRPIFLNIISNDIAQHKTSAIKSGDLGLAIRSMMKLAEKNSQKINTQEIYENQFTITPGLDNFLGKISNSLQLGITERMFTLSQDYLVDEKEINKYKYKLLQNKDEGYIQKSGITTLQMRLSFQYLEIKNLPINHSLNTREYQYYQNKYSISNEVNELPMCIVMPSFNNVQHSRYLKVLKSVNQQNYSNYHVVFIDDASTDNTSEKSKKFASKLPLAKKIIFLRNEQKKYATYNIKLAVTDYCKENEIIVLVDGDDQLLGRQVLKFINSIYQRNQYWIVYTNYFRSDYTYGGSRPVDPKVLDRKERIMAHFISPLRTFYRQLYLKIKQKDHQDKNGKYLNTLYDAAMEYPLLQMSGIQHVKYYPELTYFYNTKYGNNDDSSPMKILRRKNLHKEIVSRPKYSKLQKLSN